MSQREDDVDTEMQTAGFDDDEEFRNMFTDSDDDEDYQMGEDWEAIDDELRPSRRRRGEPREEEIDEHTQEVLSKAQEAFSLGQHQVAIKYVEGIIKEKPRTIAAFNLLSAIHEDLGDLSKALTARYCAAKAGVNNKHDWIDLAERSLELGEVKQACIFYQTASRLARDDWTLLLQRANLHADLKETGRALSLLNRIHDKYFDSLDEGSKATVMLSIARVLSQEGRVQEATSMYMGVYRRSLMPERYGEPDIVLNWQNLNVLCELLVQEGSYAEAIRILKSGARWILNRKDDDIWGNVPDDSEFDNRRFDIEIAESSKQIVLGPPSEYELPVDIRIWLLICRLKQVNDISTAAEDVQVHLGILKSYSVENYSDLYARAGLALFQAKFFREALAIYSSLTAVPSESKEEYLSLTIQVAKCHMELDNIKEAETLYSHVLASDDHNVEALVALGEIYQATKRPAGASVMVDRARRARAAAESAKESAQGTPREDSVPLLEIAAKPAPLGGQTRLNAAERAELERVTQERANANYSSLDHFRTGLDNGNIVAAGEWLRNATDLLQMFSSNRKFFPSDRNKVFRQPMRKKTLDDRMEALQDIAREDAVAGEEPDPKTDMAAVEYKFRGRPFDFWFDLFMRAALTKARYGNSEGAYELIKTASASNIFHVELGQEQTMNLAMLSCAWQAHDAPTISDALRHMYMDRQFHNDIIRLYGALLASGKSSMASFGSSNNQKFFLRQIKAVDSVVQQKRISGAARVVPDTEVGIEKENPLLFVLYAHIMLMGPSYVPALTYLMRALEHLPNDPVVLLTLGVVYVQRAIQRVTTNRHLQVLQGLSYMQDYRTTRQENEPQKQEADYNMGRYFHGLGLFSLAIPFYERVLNYRHVDPEYCLSKEAAYNLHLISAMSGNMQRSRDLVDKYLVI